MCTHAGLHARGCEFACVCHHLMSGTHAERCSAHSHQHTGTLSCKAPVGTPVSCAPSGAQPLRGHPPACPASCASKGSSEGQWQPCLARMQKLRHGETHQDSQGERARRCGLPGSAQAGMDYIPHCSPALSPPPAGATYRGVPGGHVAVAVIPLAGLAGTAGARGWQGRAESGL